MRLAGLRSALRGGGAVGTDGDSSAVVAYSGINQHAPPLVRSSATTAPRPACAILSLPDKGREFSSWMPRPSHAPQTS